MTPRGIASNNPGNIVRTSETWVGQAPVQGGRFVDFIDPGYGIRAMTRLLRTYYARGARTVRQIITTWAPPSENDTPSYIGVVSQALGVDPDQVLNLDDMLPKLIPAIIKQENGIQPYTPEQIARGIALEKEQVMGKQQFSSTVTGGFTFSGAALVAAILWICNDKLHMGMPPEVASLLGAGFVTAAHAVYNKWLKPDGEPQIPLS